MDVRHDFPQVLATHNGRRIVYLDSAATSLRAKPVVERMGWFDLHQSANVHRGAHFLSDQATDLFESARRTVAEFVGASDANEIIFTRNTTESMNLVAQAWGRRALKAGDEIWLSEMEHHSGIVPWQLVAEQTGASIKVIPVTESGELDMVSFESSVSHRMKVVSVVYVSNALGTVNPVADIVRLAKGVGAMVVVDAAQAVASERVRVSRLGCDFLAFSGHKIFGPFGIGVLWGRGELLNEMPPYQGGGSMIAEVRFEKTTYLPSPQRFEAGTPNVAGAIGLGEAIRYFQRLDLDEVRQHERALLRQAEGALASIRGLRFIGVSPSRTNILSFVLEGAHPSDVGHLLDQQNVAVRAGHHCCQPLMRRFGLPGTVRASFSVYNSPEDVSALVAAVEKARGFL